MHICRDQLLSCVIFDFLRYHGLFYIENHRLKFFECCLCPWVNLVDLCDQSLPNILNLCHLSHDHRRFMIMLVFLRALRTVIPLVAAVGALRFFLETHVEYFETSLTITFDHSFKLKQLCSWWWFGGLILHFCSRHVVLIYVYLNLFIFWRQHLSLNHTNV